MKNYLKVIPILISLSLPVQAQYNLSIRDAITFAKAQNKLVQASKTEQNAVAEDRKDTYTAALPTINATGSYQRYSNLTLFTDGLAHSTTGPRKPNSNGAALGLDALFNIYSGGKQHALQNEQDTRAKLAAHNVQDLSGSIALQTASQYLEMVRLNEQHKFILDQLKRAQTRLANINTLYNNQKVTRSDVLRAEVMLSNVELALRQNDNDILIANERLNVLMNLPDTVRIQPTDSAAMPRPAVDELTPLVETAPVASYSVLRAGDNVDIQQARTKSIQSNNLPSLSFYSAYGLNYPNYLFFPSVDQAYAIGFVGLKAQYNISSLYHNKHKLSAGKMRVKELELQQEAIADNVRTEVKSYYINYREALHRITVNEHSVEQAQVNYRIVTTKYFNQLALLTDLLDADNLYQESRLNLVKAQTDAIAIYYHLLYASGKL